MIDWFDYKEPSCSLCGGKQFYNPKKTDAIARVPISRILDKLSTFFDKNDLVGAKDFLVNWLNEAKALNDKHGELSILNELVGIYRKLLDKDNGEKIIENALSLINELNQQDTVSGATIFLNIATAYKAFGNIEKSIEIFKIAEEVYKKHLSPSDEKFGGLYNNMALSFADLKDFNSAKLCYEKAISIMEKVENGKLDLAITYVNLAHLYEDFENDKNLITDCMFTAFNLLTDESIVKNGYYAFVLEKCAPSFLHFGFSVIYNQFKKEYEEIYARN
jgi:tetratricopeptide (TPR) repeat protein